MTLGTELLTYKIVLIFRCKPANHKFAIHNTWRLFKERLFLLLKNKVETRRYERRRQNGRLSLQNVVTFVKVHFTENFAKNYFK
jgi:hypothetical protein